jgi:hypothetical protein
MQRCAKTLSFDPVRNRYSRSVEFVAVVAMVIAAIYTRARKIGTNRHVIA